MQAASARKNGRFREVRRLFAGLVLHIVWWDIILNRPILNKFRSPPIPRWTGLARRYVDEAGRLGGVLIKLGQYVGARMDLLPGEVTRILTELHDTVPPAPAVLVIAQIEADFGRPLATLFTHFESQALAAASLAQVHRARLQDGSPVVVKVLRPGISAVVEADLAVLSRAVGWVRRFPRIAKRVDLRVVAQEFARVTRLELDCLEEARNIRDFAAAFQDMDGVRAPQLYWSHSARRTLTMEDVAYFRVDDTAGYLAQGVSPTEVARRLMDCCLDQVFRAGLVHADPHPGNLFVRPLAPLPGVGGSVATPAGRPFELIFVDFGMVVRVPPHARGFLRTYAIGIATADAYTIVQSYVEGDLLLPGTDLDELERVTAAMVARLPRYFAGQVNRHELPEYGRFFAEHSDFLYNSPMKLKAELLFIYRAMGICAGTVARIDPYFDPTECFLPLAERIQRDELTVDGATLRRMGLTALGLPRRLEALLTQVERGRVRIRLESADRPARRDVRSGRAIGPAIIAAGAMISVAIYAGSGALPRETVAAAIGGIALFALIAFRS